MNRFAIKLTIVDGFKSSVHWLYVHPSGSYYKDVEDFKDATLLYSEEEVEKWLEKIKKNKHIGPFITEVVKVKE